MCGVFVTLAQSSGGFCASHCTKNNTTLIPTVFILNKHPSPCGRYEVCVYTEQHIENIIRIKKTRAVSGSLSDLAQT
jgi:hypothetical protein